MFKIERGSSTNQIKSNILLCHLILETFTVLQCMHDTLICTTVYRQNMQSVPEIAAKLSLDQENGQLWQNVCHRLTQHTQ